MVRKKRAKGARRVFINAGCGHEDSSWLPAYFESWKELRVDIDASTNPDLITSVTDLSAVPDATVHAVWSSHSLEHLYAHEVPIALGEFRRVLNPDGFVCIIVPDLQAIGNLIATDRLAEIIYESPSGPVTAHDMIFGFGPALASGSIAMAHHCGFTPTPLIKSLTEAGFEEILLRRKGSLELVAVAFAHRSGDPNSLEHILAELGF